MSYQSDIAVTDMLFAGEDKTLSYEMFAAGYGPDDALPIMENVTGWSMQWTMKLGSTTLTKTTALGGITIAGTYDAARATNTQRVIVQLTDTDTEGLTGGRYTCSLKRLDAGLEAVLSHGVVHLQVASIR
jgi:hypothetical protein